MATTWTQVNFRGRNDDGSQTTATWKAATGVNWSQAPDTKFRVRFDISETGTTTGTILAQLQYNLASAGWVSVTASSAVVKAVSSANVTDATATTQLISSGTFVAGSTDTVDGKTATSGSIAQNSHTEMEYCVQIVGTAVNAGQTLQLRIVNNTTVLGTYTNTPTVNLTITISPATKAATFSAGTAALKETIAPASQSVAFTGATPTRVVGPRASPATASVAFSGATPALKRSIAPAVVSATFSAATPDVQVHAGKPALKLTIPPATLAVAFSAATPTVTVSGAGITCSPAATSATFAGASVALKLAVPPAARSVSFASATPGLKNSIAPAATSATFSAASPALKRSIAPSSQAVAFTAATPALKRSIAPSAVTATFSASSPALKTSIPPATRAAIFSAATPTVVVTIVTTLTPASASASFNTATPALTEALVPAAASATFTGSNAALSLAVHPAAQPAAFSTATPALSTARLLSPSAQTLAFSAGTVSWQRSIAPATAAASFSGSTAAILLSISPSLRAVAFSGQPVRLKTSIPPATGTAAFATATPTLSTGRTEHPTAQSVSFIAGTPALNLIVSPAPQALIFGTGAPITLAPAAAILAFVAASPSIKVSVGSVLDDDWTVWPKFWPPPARYIQAAKPKAPQPPKQPEPAKPAPQPVALRAKLRLQAIPASMRIQSRSTQPPAAKIASCFLPADEATIAIAARFQPPPEPASSWLAGVAATASLSANTKPDHSILGYLRPGELVTSRSELLKLRRDIEDAAILAMLP